MAKNKKTWVEKSNYTLADNAELIDHLEYAVYQTCKRLGWDMGRTREGDNFRKVEAWKPSGDDENTLANVDIAFDLNQPGKLYRRFERYTLEPLADCDSQQKDNAAFILALDSEIQQTLDEWSKKHGQAEKRRIEYLLTAPQQAKLEITEYPLDWLSQVAREKTPLDEIRLNVCYDFVENPTDPFLRDFMNNVYGRLIGFYKQNGFATLPDEKILTEIALGWIDQLEYEKKNGAIVEIEPRYINNADLLPTSVLTAIEQYRKISFGQWQTYLDADSTLRGMEKYYQAVRAQPAPVDLGLAGAAGLPEIKDPSDKRAWEFIQKDPSITDDELAAKLNTSRQIANGRRRTLEKMGYPVRVSRQKRASVKTK